MQKVRIAIIFFLIGFLSLELPATAQAQATSAFDGNWLVILTCSASADGALGYTYRFPAVVSGGILDGEHETKGMPGHLVLESPIQSDGTSMLLVTGLTGRPQYTAGKVKSLAPYSYHVSAHFDRSNGYGKRIELRACALAFSRAS
jgi:hypothetical protein